jgi:hypothetical protein
MNVFKEKFLFITKGLLACMQKNILSVLIDINKGL